jgi:hypothetical protein
MSFDKGDSDEGVCLELRRPKPATGLRQARSINVVIKGNDHAIRGYRELFEFAAGGNAYDGVGSPVIPAAGSRRDGNDTGGGRSRHRSCDARSN